MEFAGCLAVDGREAPPLFGLSFLLVTVSIYSLGMLVASVAGNIKTANLLCTVLYFPMLIFSGGHLKTSRQAIMKPPSWTAPAPVRRFFSITLPLLTPIIFFNLINQVIGAFQAFNSSYLITKGKPLNTTLYYGVHLYNKAFNQFEMGYGSAMAWFMLLIIAFFTALTFPLLQRLVIMNRKEGENQR